MTVGFRVTDPPQDPPQDAASSLVIRASSVKSRSIRWAWRGRLAIGYLVVQTGVEGLGKSVFAAWMLGRLSRGALDGEWEGQPVNILVLAGEDGIADTWRPRLDLAGADLDRISFLNLDAAVTEVDAKVILIDAALDHMPAPRAGESINGPTFVRQAFAPLRRLTRDRELVTDFSMHPPKARSNEFRDLVQAAQAFSAMPRIGLLFAYHPDDAADDPQRRRVLLRGKGNLDRDPGGLEFHVAGRLYEHDDGRVTDRGVVVDVAPSNITLADLAPDRTLGAREPTKTERSTDIIRDALHDGDWHPAAPILAQLADVGLTSDSVISAARRRAHVSRRKQLGQTNGPWEWRLDTPSDTPNGFLDSSTPARAFSHRQRILGFFTPNHQQRREDSNNPQPGTPPVPRLQQSISRGLRARARAREHHLHLLLRRRRRRTNRRRPMPTLLRPNQSHPMPRQRSQEAQPAPSAVSARPSVHTAERVLEVKLMLDAGQLDAIAVRVAELMQVPDRPLPVWLDAEGAAEYLATSRGRIHDLVQLGKLDPRRDGRRLLFRIRDLDAYLEPAA